MPFPTVDLFSMDTVIFGGFFGLSLAAVAFNHLARNTDQQKQSVSNTNFLSFQRSFFFVYFLALSGDWLQGENQREGLGREDTSLSLFASRASDGE